MQHVAFPQGYLAFRPNTPVAICTLDPRPCNPRVQVRPSSLIVFVPKYGIEGPVFLEDEAAAAAASGRAAAGSAVDSAYIYDEDKQVWCACVCVAGVG